MVYDLVVVGAGMIGSAAAYHASHIAGKSVCLIGPPEPKSRKRTEVFGSWYDEGRICRIAYSGDIWSVLAVNSMEKYRQLEEESGISFYTERGFIYITTKPEEYQSILKEDEEGIQMKDVSGNWKEYFEYLNLPDDAHVLWEQKKSGYINPRKILEACQKVALENGTPIIPEIVTAIKPSSSLSNSHRWEVSTEEGKVICANSVLVATGAYAGFNRLFEYVAPHRVPDVNLRTQTVAFLRIPSEEAERLKSMPTMVTTCYFDNLDGAYILPPIMYPDGNWYLKLGHKRKYEERKHTYEEVVDWFRQQTGIPECVEKLGKFLCHMLPGLQVEEVSGDGCITTHTPDYDPYIDIIGEGFAVALGGNGYAAKSCYEIGRLASHLVLLGEWDSKIPRDRVKMKWKVTSSL